MGKPAWSWLLQLLEIKASKFTEVIYCCLVVSFCSFNRSFEIAEMFIFAIKADLSVESTSSSEEVDSLKARQGEGLFLYIELVFFGVADSQVAPTIVQRVVVDVVNHQPRRWPHYLSVHLKFDAARLRAYVKCVGLGRRLQSMPR